eukprot:TRINITY_DN16502_c0_g1_i1.p1 TRINITY_DN16502_c0_g1~~TRINITY_DN16502_c0_g1_i1.p1  ORF type:complete len:142 (-),score=21.89 TRINITY_DN16502_c0_g1_i1:13-438(-)
MTVHQKYIIQQNFNKKFNCDILTLEYENKPSFRLPSISPQEPSFQLLKLSRTKTCFYEPKTYLNKVTKNNMSSKICRHSGKTKKRTRLHPSLSQILKNWLYSHADNPYPTKEEKNEFARITGLSYRQVDTWFVNGRKRYLN